MSVKCLDLIIWVCWLPFMKDGQSNTKDYSRNVQNLYMKPHIPESHNTKINKVILSMKGRVCNFGKAN